MNETSIVVAGFGGQGVLLAGQLLAYAGMDAGRHVTWIPSYGPEMRGGTAHCTVIISDEPIGSPVVARPDVVIALNQPSFVKYKPLLKEGGLLVGNGNLVTAVSSRSDIETLFVPLNELAEKHGSNKMVNVTAVGALLARRPVLSLEVVAQALRDHLPARKAHLLEQNLLVLQAGHDFAMQGALVG